MSSTTISSTQSWKRYLINSRRPGLDPGAVLALLQRLRQSIVEVVPIGIGLFDQGKLPRPSPPFQALLMGNAVVDGVAAFGPDKPGQVAPSAIIGTSANPVHRNPHRQRAGYADIERAAITIGHDVDPATQFFAIHAAI